MSKGKLKKHLLTMTKEQMVDVVLELYDASKEAKDWLEFYLEPDCDAQLDKCKRALHNFFYKRNGYPKYPKFRECNKLITAFRKLVAEPEPVAELLLYYVEQGCNAIATFGDFDEAYRRALTNNFIKAMMYISGSGLRGDFAERIERMIHSVRWCGDGFPDGLWEIYEKYTEEYMME